MSRSQLGGIASFKEIKRWRKKTSIYTHTMIQKKTNTNRNNKNKKQFFVSVHECSYTAIVELSSFDGALVWNARSNVYDDHFLKIYYYQAVKKSFIPQFQNAQGTYMFLTVLPMAALTQELLKCYMKNIFESMHFNLCRPCIYIYL